MNKGLKVAMDTIHILTQKKNYKQFTTKDIETSIIEAVDMISKYYKKPMTKPSYLDMSREDMIDCSIQLWTAVGEALMDGIVNKR